MNNPTTALEKPKVLVLLAAYNGAQWIREQLDSILRQRDLEVTVIVRDDGSTDHTAAIANGYLTTGRVHVRTQAANSGSPAKNFFAMIRDEDVTGFGYIAFSDQDDIWNEDKLARAVGKLVLRDIAGYSAGVAAFWKEGLTRIIRPSARMTRSDFLLEGAGQGCTFVLTADFYRQARVFLLANRHMTAAIHYHDWCLYALARAWNMRWHFDSTPVLRYRQHGTNDTGARQSLAGVRRRISLIRSGWYRSQLLAIAKLCTIAAPESAAIRDWIFLLESPPSLYRTMRMLLFCLQGGRRRWTDNIIVMFAVLAGHI